VLAAAFTLPFVLSAEVRPAPVNANVIGWGTNTEMPATFQVLRAPGGVDAIHAWQIEGGTGVNVSIADIENSWDLNHEDLLTASIQRASTFGTDNDPTHGTGVLGIVLAGDNGVGIVGIAPDARAFLVTTERQGKQVSPAAAVVAAAAAIGPGGIVLIEQALPFFAGQNNPDILWESNPQTQKAIRLATFFGITVVEPAGNGGVNLDAFPFFAHVQPTNAAFVDSRAIVVGAGAPSGEVANPTWRRTFSTFGARVDCFAAGAGVRAPSTAPSTYTNFGGTSGASAIIAGVCCAIQGMTLSATTQVLLPTDIRRLLRDPTLGTPTGVGLPGGIGSMPDLRRIARRLNFMRALPVTLLSRGPDAMTLVHLDDEDTLVRREWRSATLWGDRISVGADATFVVSPQQAAALASVEVDLPRTVVDVAALGRDGDVHHIFWDSLGQLGRLSPVRAPHDTLAQGHDVSAVRSLVDTLVIVGIDPSGRLVSMQGDASLHLATGLSTPVVIDPIASFRRCAGPVLVSHGDGTMDVVAIDDGGNMRAARGTSLATIGTGWAPPVTVTPNVVLDPAVRPGLVATTLGLVAIAADTRGVLHFAEISLVPPVLQPFAPIDATVTLAGRGPVALVATSTRLAAIAVSADFRLHAAFRSLAPGAAWSTLDPIDANVAVHRLGGVSAAVVDDTVAVAAVLSDGRSCWSRFIPGSGWLPIRAA
jgi:Subtilase family